LKTGSHLSLSLKLCIHKWQSTIAYAQI
jgi:hypothetical protein